MKLLSLLTQKKIYSGGFIALFVALGVFLAEDRLDAVMEILKGSRSLADSGRQLSVYLGGGNCEWTPPLPVVPDDLDLWKTLLVGFPSGDKRMAFVQMEALSGLPSKDDWDFVFNGYSNAPFIKTNYPHPMGVWSWGSEANQVALVIQYIRRSLVEYADIQWYMSFENDYNSDREVLEQMYGRRLDTEDFYAWRDQHVLEEIYKYGWYIDFWMENGLYRDPYTHNVIDADTFEMYRKSTTPKSDQIVHVCHRTDSPTNPYIVIEIAADQLDLHLAHGDFVGHCDKAVKDPNFVNYKGMAISSQAVRDPSCNLINGSCRPVTIISADRLRDFTEGPKETELIGNLISHVKKTGRYVIDRASWDCVWEQIVELNKGPKTFEDRDIADDPNFSVFMLTEMKGQVQRLIKKYSNRHWLPNPQANRLVELLSEHLPMLQTEIDDIASGRRTLTAKDILGPGERKLRSGEAVE